MWDWNLSGQHAHVSIMDPLYTWVNSRKKIKTRLLHMFNAVNSVGICWHHKLKEPNMSPACLLSTLSSNGSLQNITLSEMFKAFTTTPLQKKNKEWMNDVLGILAMRHFGGKGGFELMLWNQSIESVPGWLEVTSNGLALWWCQYHPICVASSWLGLVCKICW